VNILDILILIVGFRYLVKKKNRRFVHVFINSVAVSAGYLVGFLISLDITKGMEFDVDKGATALVFMFGFAVLFKIPVAIVRKIVLRIRKSKQVVVIDTTPVYKNTDLRLEGDTQYSKAEQVPVVKQKLLSFEHFNSWLTIPYKIMFLILSIYIMSQTLFYIPIQWIQFTIQGSAAMMLSARILPDSNISEMAKQFSPNEFNLGKLSYDFDFSGSGDFKQVVSNASPSIVRLITQKCGGFSGGSGSGSLIAPGLVVTNQHVVSGASAIYVINQNGRYPATTVSIDKDHDIAIVYSKYLDKKSQPIEISTGGALIGSDAVSVGYPSASEDRFSTVVGKVKYNSVNSLNTKLGPSTTFLLDKGLGAGSSGGPVLDKSGKIIGMNVAGSTGVIAINADLLKDAIEKAKNLPIPAFSLMCEYTSYLY